MRYWEAEIHTPRLVKDHVDLTFGVGFNTGKEEGRVEADEHGWWPEIETYMWDVHLGARVFPQDTRADDDDSLMKKAPASEDK
jgi:hypothetical protein